MPIETEEAPGGVAPFRVGECVAVRMGPGHYQLGHVLRITDKGQVVVKYGYPKKRRMTVPTQKVVKALTPTRRRGPEEMNE